MPLARFLFFVSLISLSSCSYQDPLFFPDESRGSLSIDTALAPPDNSPKVSLSQLSDRVIRNHPNLRAAKLRIREAEGRVVQAGLPPNPSIGLGSGKTGLEGEWDLSASFSQQFPITNRLGLEKRVSRLQLEMAKAELLDVQRLLIAQAQALTIELLALRAKEAQITAQVQLLETVASFIETAAERGEMSSLDGTQARVEVGKLQSEIDALVVRQKRNMIRLKAAFGMSPEAPLELHGELAPPAPLRNPVRLENRPDYQFKEIEQRAAMASISLEKARRYGDVTSNIQAGITRQEDAPDGLETEGRIGVGMSVPLPLYNDNQGNIERAQARAERVRLERQALAVKIREQSAAALTESNGWIALYQRLDSQLIPSASNNSELLEEAFRNGQASFISLLQARKQELELKAQLIDTLESYHQSRNDFFTAIGQAQNAY